MELCLSENIMVISIHPPRGGGTEVRRGAVTNLFISIHPPRGGGTAAIAEKYYAKKFQSTHPVGVGQYQTPLYQYHGYFNPPTPWGWDWVIRQNAEYPERYFNPPTPWGWDDVR